MDKRNFDKLISYLEKIPSMQKPIAFEGSEDGFWWVKFSLDINNKLAWNAIQELGCVVNYISVGERLPTTFYPVSPAPYMNGGPEDYLSWVIENTDKDFKPSHLFQWLEGRLPNPVDDLDQWDIE